MAELQKMNKQIRSEPEESKDGQHKDYKNRFLVGERDHWSVKKAAEMSERDWRIFREDNEIIIKGGRVPQPMREWEEGANFIPNNIMETIRQIGYKKPTPIQMQSIPIGMERRDLIGIAPTGSGKSAA